MALDIQVTIEYRFTLKRVLDMIRIQSNNQISFEKKNTVQVFMSSSIFEFSKELRGIYRKVSVTLEYSIGFFEACETSEIQDKGFQAKFKSQLLTVDICLK